MNGTSIDSSVAFNMYSVTTSLALSLQTSMSPASFILLASSIEPVDGSNAMILSLAKASGATVGLNHPILFTGSP